jgi:CheY-like chemotaxis protein
VEDHPLVRITVQSYLEGLGYQALMAADADQAVQICAQRGASIDLLLTDVMMPGRLGRELARELCEKRPDLPVLFMSAHPAEELARLGHVDPHAPLLSKPFDQRSLAFAIRRALGDAPEAGIPPANGERTPSPEAAGADPPESCSRRVLVVDDDPDIGDTLREALELEGHTAAVARSGPEALVIARELVPEVVLCDLELGQPMSGYDVARALRADERLRGAHILAVTGFSADGCRADCAEAGFDEVMTKPVDLGRLQARLADAPRSDPT